jgi:hypothetical protein
METMIQEEITFKVNNDTVRVVRYIEYSDEEKCYCVDKYINGILAESHTIGGMYDDYGLAELKYYELVDKAKQ